MFSGFQVVVVSNDKSPKLCKVQGRIHAGKGRKREKKAIACSLVTSWKKHSCICTSALSWFPRKEVKRKPTKYQYYTPTFTLSIYLYDCVRTQFRFLDFPVTPNLSNLWCHPFQSKHALHQSIQIISPITKANSDTYTVTSLKPTNHHHTPEWLQIWDWDS